MHILALDASTDVCAAALGNGASWVERMELAGQRHSELLLPMVLALLNEARLELPDLGGIAFGAGPGSFTGLRIACGIAQGLAAGAGLKVAAVSTLEALAEEAWQAGEPAGDSPAEHVVACVDARMGEVYHAAYRREKDGWLVCSPPGLYDV